MVVYTMLFLVCNPIWFKIILFCITPVFFEQFFETDFFFYFHKVYQGRLGILVVIHYHTFNHDVYSWFSGIIKMTFWWDNTFVIFFRNDIIMVSLSDKTFLSENTFSVFIHPPLNAHLSLQIPFPNKVRYLWTIPEINKDCYAQ